MLYTLQWCSLSLVYCCWFVVIDLLSLVSCHWLSSLVCHHWFAVIDLLLSVCCCLFIAVDLSLTVCHCWFTIVLFIASLDVVVLSGFYIC